MLWNSATFDTSSRLLSSYTSVAPPNGCICRNPRFPSRFASLKKFLDMRCLCVLHAL
jgi:hypothetical protein